MAEKKTGHKQDNGSLVPTSGKGRITNIIEMSSVTLDRNERYIRCEFMVYDKIIDREINPNV